MRDIRVGADVEALIGSEIILRLHRDAFTRYGCCACGGLGSTDEEPTTVVVMRYRSGKSQILFAHARCAGSQIREADVEPPEGSFGEMDMRAAAAVLADPSTPTPWPLLLIEPLADAMTLTETGEQVNLFLSHMLTAGLWPVRAGEALPGLADGWELRLHGPDTVRLRSTDGTVVYEGGCEQPESWRALVLGTGSCTVLVGAIGLYAVPHAEMTPARLLSLIDSAVRAGELVGGIVTAREGGT